jgi:hypothetical protein
MLRLETFIQFGEAVSQIGCRGYHQRLCARRYKQ